MTDSPAPARDIEDLYMALFDAYPREALQLLCGVQLDDQTTVVEVEAPWSSESAERMEFRRDIARRFWEHGREQGRADAMRALLRARYGEFGDLDDLAQRLAEGDPEGHVARIVDGVPLGELRS
ncbi:hypothetical protein [Paractinoplanes atraurantiacus]|uniref:Uncharacterized protein n=1 Tax=Paractinoplanes atraurantiacus TaxID=1036182 RepID=A0A285IFP4_9ACTN|nr:hypothetical protein [Actinoplanes atraurantiacus]SNY46789.1 hypothetical protein SAMN05421748_1084 [Actinoplanes atraurantiacus]